MYHGISYLYYSTQGGGSWWIINGLQNNKVITHYNHPLLATDTKVNGCFSVS